MEHCKVNMNYIISSDYTMLENDISVYFKMIYFHEYIFNGKIIKYTQENTLEKGQKQKSKIEHKRL